MKTKNVLLTAALALAASRACATPVFSEDFGTLADGTVIDTANTDLTYVRLSTGAGTKFIEAQNPSNTGSGASALVLAPTSSLSGIGVGDALPSSAVYTLQLSLRFSNVAAGDVVIGVGAGATFTGNSTFSTSQGLFWLQSDSGNFERRTTAWSDVGSGFTFVDGVTYQLHVVANGSAVALNYGGDSVAAGTMDIWLDGTLIDDDVAVTTPALAANGFRIYSVSGTTVEVDNIRLWNEAASIPEPSVLGLLLLSVGLLFRLRRR